MKKWCRLPSEYRFGRRCWPWKSRLQQVLEAVDAIRLVGTGSHKAPPPKLWESYKGHCDLLLSSVKDQ